MRIAAGNQLSPTQNLIGNGDQANTRNAATYATWNPIDKGSSVTLSNGNLTAAYSDTAINSLVRSTISKSSGKWYWEVTITAGNMAIIGIANALATYQYLGSDANGWGYFNGTGVKINNVTQTPYGATYTTNDVIGIALDMDSGTITMYKNNSSQGTMFSSLSGSLFAAVSGALSPSSTMVANFGADHITYTPPVGFNAGLYN